MAQGVKNPAGIHEDVSLIPGQAQRVTEQASGLAVSCGVGPRCGSDSELLWLWHRPAATSLIGPLAWELPYATGMTLKRQRERKQINEYNETETGSQL